LGFVLSDLRTNFGVRVNYDLLDFRPSVYCDKNVQTVTVIGSPFECSSDDWATDAILFEKSPIRDRLSIDTAFSANSIVIRIRAAFCIMNGDTAFAAVIREAGSALASMADGEIYDKLLA